MIPQVASPPSTTAGPMTVASDATRTPTRRSRVSARRGSAAVRNMADAWGRVRPSRSPSPAIAASSSSSSAGVGSWPASRNLPTSTEPWA